MTRYWKGQIEPGTRSSEVVSSLDLFPTASSLAGMPLPTDRVYDGRDMSDVLLKPGGKSKHDVLFFYGGAAGPVQGGPSAARMGCWKAHWGTGPGMGGCTLGAGQSGKCPSVKYPADDPLLFNVCIDPSEGIPPAGADNGTVNGAHFQNSNPGPTMGLPVLQAEIDAAQTALVAAYRKELSTFTHGQLVEPDLLPGEKGANVRVCCDKDPFRPVPAKYTCDCDGAPYPGGAAEVFAYTPGRQWKCDAGETS